MPRTLRWPWSPLPIPEPEPEPEPPYDWAAWRHRTLQTLVTEVFPPQVPYQYDAAFSFLQEEFDPVSPLRLDLFFPDYPLAIDVLPLAESRDYREAADFQDRESWERGQAQGAQKRALLDRYRCPYLVVRHYEPVDASNLRERVRTLLGRYPR